MAQSKDINYVQVRGINKRRACFCCLLELTKTSGKFAMPCCAVTQLSLRLYAKEVISRVVDSAFCDHVIYRLKQEMTFPNTNFFVARVPSECKCLETA